MVNKEGRDAQAGPHDEHAEGSIDDNVDRVCGGGVIRKPGFGHWPTTVASGDLHPAHGLSPLWAEIAEATSTLEPCKNIWPMLSNWNECKRPV